MLKLILPMMVVIDLLDEDFVANLTTMYLTNATLDAAKFKTYPINISDLKDIYQENVLKEIFNNPYLLIERVEKIKDSTSKSSDIHSFGTDYKKYHEKYKNDYMPCDYRRKRHL